MSDRLEFGNKNNNMIAMVHCDIPEVVSYRKGIIMATVMCPICKKESYVSVLHSVSIWEIKHEDFCRYQNQTESQ